VLQEPPPGVLLTAFADNGLELTLVFWIADPSAGMNNVRSDANLAVLKLLNRMAVEIPYPQRVLRTPPDS
jgi:small-conductance mechanosensitive channel